MGLFSWLFGGDGGVTKGDYFRLIRREKFSSYLPWAAYDKAKQVYLNTDNTLGVMWECSPLAFASENTINTLGGLFRFNLPDGAIMQFILLADPHIDPIVNTYGVLKTRESKLIHDVSDKMTQFLRMA